MSLSDYIAKNLPSYYPSMYLDGYSPEQIREAARQDMLAEFAAQDEGYEVSIKSEVSVK